MHIHCSIKLIYSTYFVVHLFLFYPFFDSLNFEKVTVQHKIREREKEHKIDALIFTDF